jgi:zinc transport system substrate-binding protein
MKKILMLIGLFGLSFSLSGCFKKDTMDDINIYTSVYPIEYITNKLYGTHSTIYSIYPNGIDVNDYKLTDKQISDYSNSNLFVYNGISKENKYAVSMLNKNKNIKIIDAAFGMEYTNSIEEIWLDSSNFLMLAQNVKNGLNEYISNPYFKKNIDDNYEDLKLAISEFDAELKLTVENAVNKTIVVDNDMFKYLEKYGFNVISLEENNNLTAKTVSNVESLIRNNYIDYIFIKDNDEPNKTIANLKNNTDVQFLNFNTITSITDSERLSNEDYITLMYKNLELLKMEIFK